MEVKSKRVNSSIEMSYAGIRLVISGRVCDCTRGKKVVIYTEKNEGTFKGIEINHRSIKGATFKG